MSEAPRKIVALPIREFAVPVPRIGSIEAHSGYGKALEGLEIHQRVQKRRGEESVAYQSEVKLSAEFEREGYTFQISGRMDGLFTTEPPRIEEIKSCFSTKELLKKLRDDSTHPYCLQLLTYGYFYYLQNKVKPLLAFHLVSSRDGSSDDLTLKLKVGDYEDWLERRLAELVLESQQNEARAERRQKIAGKFAFPFETPRTGQVDLISTVETHMAENKRMLIQAPTGLGKTAGVLYPSLKEALRRGQSVVYVTPKNSQHSVAEDAVDRFRDTGSKVKSLTITAKAKICFKNEPLCNPDHCEFAKDHYTKVHEYDVLGVLAKKKKLNARVFRAVGEEYQVCPFELQLDAAKDAEVVICDYNYVFNPRAAFGRLSQTTIGQTGRPNLVIDEAHNLYARGIGYYSPELSTSTLERMRADIPNLPQRFRDSVEKLISACQATVLACAPKHTKESAEIDPPVELFLQQDGELRAFMSRYLESDVEVQPRDVVLRLSYYWSEFTEALDFVGSPKRPEFFTTFRPFGKGGAVKITCCDASEMLKACYDDYNQVVGFSATLKPYDYYAKLSGLDPTDIQFSEFQSPFPKHNRKLLIIPEISTKYSDRERNYGKVGEVIRRVAELKAGNYFAFFPSFEFAERVLERFFPPDGFTVLQQTRDMKPADVENIMEHLKKQTAPTLVFAVQGGHFSEGVDYPGDMIIGAFVVGPALPNFDLEREKMRAYYQEHYGAGFDYAYSYPAMAKVVQAAGRVVRSETDRGLIVLMDTRFIQTGYARSMPRDWFDENPQELVSKSILKEVADFWAESGN